MPSCSPSTEAHGPAHTVTKYVASAGVVASSVRPGATSRAAPLPSTVHARGAVTATVYGALRSGWSKQANTVGAASRKRWP